MLIHNSVVTIHKIYNLRLIVLGFACFCKLKAVNLDPKPNNILSP